MRKISKTRIARQQLLPTEEKDARPGRISGGTVTSWRPDRELDLAAIVSRLAGGATVTGAATPTPDRIAGDCEIAKAGDKPTTISLSDGTRITFATAVPLTNPKLS